MGIVGQEGKAAKRQTRDTWLESKACQYRVYYWIDQEQSTLSGPVKGMATGHTLPLARSVEMSGTLTQ